MLAASERTARSIPTASLKAGTMIETGRRQPSAGLPADEPYVATRKGEQEEDPGDEEQRDGDEQEAEQSRHPTGHGERRDQDLSAGAAPAPLWNLRLVASQAAELGNGDELEAAGAQRGHQPLDRAHGLGAVAPTVVKEDDPATLALGRSPGDDLVHPGAPPILTVEIGEDDVVAVARETAERLLLPRSDGGGNRGVRRPDETRADADRANQGVLGQADLEPLLPAGQGREIGVRERVVPELESVPMQPADEVGVTDDLAPDDEEGGRSMETLERSDDARSPAWVRPVVEGERDSLARTSAPGDELLSVPGEDRSGGCERPTSTGCRCRASARRSRRQALNAEQNGEHAEQDREQHPAGRLRRPTLWTR